MKLWRVIIFPVFLYATTSAHADGAFIEGGLGFKFSTDSKAMFLSYHIDSSPIFRIKSFYNLALGSWNGQNHNNAIVLVKGIWWDLPSKTYFSFEPGGAYMVKTSNNLGTHLQFAFRFALGMRAEKIDLSNQLQNYQNVIPAKAGIQSFQVLLDPRLRGGDTFY